MRVIAIEEHFSSPAIREATKSGEWASRILELGELGLRLGTGVIEQLEDLGEGRLAAMDAVGIDLRVLSHTQPGVEGLDAAEAVPLAREANDLLAQAIARHPDRFSGFAILPTAAPDAAAAELDRAVRRLGLKGALINGRTNGRFLDDPFFFRPSRTTRRPDLPSSRAATRCR